MNGWLVKLLIPLAAGVVIAAGNRFYDVAVAQARLETKLERVEQDVRLLMNHIAINGEDT